MSKGKIAMLVVSLAVLFIGGAFAAYKLGKGKGGEVASERTGENQAASNPEIKKEEVEIPEEESVWKIYHSEAEGLEVSAPKASEKVSSPLSVKGRAKGGWFFEGSFPVKLLTSQRKVFAQGYVTAEGEWMTEDWVKFSGTLDFVTPYDAGGFLLFEKDNPSGLPEHDLAVSLPLKFNLEDKKTIGPDEDLNTSQSCGGYPASDPILGDCGEDCDTSSWKIFKNQKYGYSFRYPAEYVLTNNCKNTKCVSEEGEGDTVVMSGDLSTNGWPMIEIRHYSTEAYNPPGNIGTSEWIKEKFSWTKDCLSGTPNIYFTQEDDYLLGGFDVFFPGSPQALSRREIFYSLDGKIFQLVMLDVKSPQARQFYDIWLSTFHLAGE